jgi:hypothetical protein
MALPPASIFDLSARRVIVVDRFAARQLIAEHRAGAVHPVPGDLLAVCWWALLPDPFAEMATIRGPVVWFGAEPTWRRILVVPPTVNRARFELRARALLPPERLWRWYGRVAQGWYRRNASAAQSRHAVAAE